MGVPAASRDHAAAIELPSDGAMLRSHSAKADGLPPPTGKRNGLMARLTSKTHAGRLNVHGDQLISAETAATHGADISWQRTDELDRRFLRNCLDMLEVTAAQGSSAIGLDLGSGYGRPSIAAALFGVEMHLYDLLDLAQYASRLRKTLNLSCLRYHRGDLSRLNPEDLPPMISVVYSQRFVHYLRFSEAVALLRSVTDRLVPHGRIFISASGLRSELGVGYKHKALPIQQRFARISPEMAEKHGIHEPVALYELEDLDKLLLPMGCEREWDAYSEFGNVKACFVKAG
jgi:SAM-dependent methyltransferase